MRLSGIYKQFSDEINAERNSEIHAFSNRLRQNLIAGVTDIIPSYCNIYIEFDLEQLSKQKLNDWLDKHLNNLDIASNKRTIKIPVDYSGQDLEYISQETGLSVKEVIQKHSDKIYQVYAMGFTPGFPFMAEVDESIQLARRGVPRLSVPAASVAMANAQTGIYPFSSPGGWHILGQALVHLYDPNRVEPFLLKPGDMVKFVAAAPKKLNELNSLELLAEAKYPFLKVLETGLLDLLVDQGRFLAGHLGLSRSGPIDAKLANLANSLLANKKNAVVLEINIVGPKFEVLSEGLIAFAGYSLQLQINGNGQEAFKTILLKVGDIISFASVLTAGPCYLAIAGGFSSKRFMASASVDLRAKIARVLQVDDILGKLEVDLTRRAKRSFKPYYKPVVNQTLRLIKGPQYSSAIKELCKNTYTVAQKDRMGIRFAGAKVSGYGITSEAVPLGALQITNDGMPILLLNDRGTIGGYSKPAILHPDDFSKAAQLAVASKVSFTF